MDKPYPRIGLGVTEKNLGALERFITQLPQDLNYTLILAWEKSVDFTLNEIFLSLNQHPWPVKIVEESRALIPKTIFIPRPGTYIELYNEMLFARDIQDNAFSLKNWHLPPPALQLRLNNTLEIYLETDGNLISQTIPLNELAQESQAFEDYQKTQELIQTFLQASDATLAKPSDLTTQELSDTTFLSKYNDFNLLEGSDKNRSSPHSQEALSTQQDELFRFILKQEYLPNCILLDESLKVLYSYGAFHPLLQEELSLGTRSIISFLPVELQAFFENNFELVRKHQTRVKYDELLFEREAKKYSFGMGLKFIASFRIYLLEISFPHQSEDKKFPHQSGPQVFIDGTDRPSVPAKAAPTSSIDSLLDQHPFMKAFEESDFESLEDTCYFILDQKRLVSNISYPGVALKKLDQWIGCDFLHILPAACKNHFQEIYKNFKKVNQDHHFFLHTQRKSFEGSISSFGIGGLDLLRIDPGIAPQIPLVLNQLRKELQDKNRRIQQLDSQMKARDLVLEKAMSRSRSAEAKWKAIYEQGVDTMCLINREGFILSNNHNLFGEKVSEVVGKLIFEFVPDAQKGMVKQHLQHTFYNNEPTRFLSVYQKDNQEEIWTSNTLSPISKDGKTDAVLLISRDISELKNKEIDLKKLYEDSAHLNKNLSQLNHKLNISNQQLELFVKYAPASVAMLDQQFNYVLVSEQWIRDFGIKGLSLIGRKHDQSFPLLNETFQDSIKKALLGESFKEEAAYFHGAKGREEWIKFEIHPWYFHDEEVGGIMIFTQLVTAQKKAAQRLTQSEEKYRLITQNSQDLICLHQKNGTYLYLSPSSQEMIGFKPEELLGTDPYLLFHPKDRDFIRKLSHDKALRGEGGQKIQYRLRKKDGKYIWVETITKTLYNKRGEVERLLTSTRNISENKSFEVKLQELNQELNLANTELTASNEKLSQVNQELSTAYIQLKQSENNLKEQKKLLDLVIKSVGVGLFVYNSQTENIVCNENCVELLGEQLRSIRDIYDWPPLKNLFQADQTSPLSPYDLPLFKSLTGEKCPPMEIFVQFPHSLEGRFISIYSSSLRNEKSEIIGAMMVLRDISEEKRQKNEIFKLNNHLEELVQERTHELLENRKELETFNYTISHDLRSPIRAITGNIFMIKESFADITPEEIKGFLNRIESGAIRIGDLIDDLLTFSQSGKQAIKRERINMYRLFEEVFDELMLLENYPMPEFFLQKIPETFADLNMCRLVIHNLLGNALKYSSRNNQARVEVGFRHQGGRNIYFVKDNGVGFDPESSEKIFEVFERAHLRKEFEGNGIGLAIVKRIVEKHLGIVWAESNLGQGATFFFCLESPETSKLV